MGARNMQNFELLKAVGRQKKPVLLKRGLANTLEELVMSAEYIMAEGNENVILCERGIRTFETSMRNTLDLAGVVMLHKMTHLPVVVDPSHACGHAWMVPQLAKAAVAAGADGLMIEVHNNPAKAKCDGAQSLTPDQFDELMRLYRQRGGVLRQKAQLILCFHRQLLLWGRGCFFLCALPSFSKTEPPPKVFLDFAGKIRYNKSVINPRRCVGMADEGDSKSLVLITRVGSTPTTGITKGLQF